MTGPSEQPTPPRPPVAIKGGKDGLRIAVSKADPDDVEANLREQLERRAGSFFHGASVILAMPPGRLDLALVARLGEVIEEAGMELTGVAAGSTELRQRETPRPTVTLVPPSAALLASGTLRSGQRIVHDGAVVVLGDVNPGAEVVAGGSVVVWGRLRGTVEAGLAGQQDDVVVCALDLAPTQLRIGSALARAPEEPDRTPEPEVAREVGGQIVVDAWE